MPFKCKYNWDKLLEAYLTTDSGLNYRDFAQKHGVKLGTLKQKAQAQGWADKRGERKAKKKRLTGDSKQSRSAEQKLREINDKCLQTLAIEVAREHDDPVLQQSWIKLGLEYSQIKPVHRVESVQSDAEKDDSVRKDLESTLLQLSDAQSDAS